MKPILYFLRSTEQRIATNLLHFAKRLDAAEKTLADFPELAIYEKHYGFTDKDLGLYALAGHEIAGAVWTRLLKKEDASDAYVNDETPILNIAVKPEFRGQGIAKLMLEQLFIEAGALYDQISVSADSDVEKFFEHFGFAKVKGSDKKSIISGSNIFTMTKELTRAEIKRPTDGYDPTRWMD